MRDGPRLKYMLSIAGAYYPPRVCCPSMNCQPIDYITGTWTLCPILTFSICLLRSSSGDCIRTWISYVFPISAVLYINDITKHIESSILLMIAAYYTEPSKHIKINSSELQSTTWMGSKVHFKRTLSPIIFNYKLNGNNFGTSCKHSYLGETANSRGLHI